MEEKTEKAQTFKEDDLVVIVEAFPDVHNGKVACYKHTNSRGHLVLLIHGGTWCCEKIRHATLLEKELAEC